MPSTVLVTGSSGFIGRALTVALARAGFRVRAATRTPYRLRPHPDIEPVAVPDFTTGVDWGRLLQGVDRVVHLAGIAHMAPRLHLAGHYDRVNRGATEELARAAARADIRRFVFVSSVGAQSGPAADHVVTEADAPYPTEQYGSSKLIAERAISYAGVNHTILRPVVVYGPNVKGNVRTLMRLARSSWPLPLAGFANKRSLLGLDNLVSAITFALVTPGTSGQTYLVADPEALTIAEIITTLRIAAQRSPRLYAVPPKLFETAFRIVGRGDVWDRVGGTLVVDSGKLIAAGWRPAIDTRTGLTLMMQASMARPAAQSHDAA